MKVIARCPETTIIEEANSTWVVFGLVSESPVNGIDGSFEEMIDILQESVGEFNLVRIKKNPVRHIDAYRDVTSSYEMYMIKSSSGEAIITDTFHDAVACLDVADRTVSESALADHYLFRTTLGTNTYLDEIDRLGHGEWLQWEVESDRKIRTQFRRLSATPKLRSKPDVLTEIDSGLEEIYEGITDRSKAPFVTMLSGGIDSTLLQTYSPTPKTMSVNVTAPEFQPEVGYAERASELTGSLHTLVTLEESSFLEALEETTEALGKPPHHLQKVFWDAAFRAGDWKTYATGIFGDSWFGEDSAKVAALASRLLPFVNSPLADFGQRILRGRFSTYGEAVSETAEKLQRPLSHPFGLANSFANYGDYKIASSVTSRELAIKRLNDRFRYVTRVVDLPIGGETSALGAHLEFGHIINYYMSNSGQLGRQLAQQRDVTLFTPFTDRYLAEVALSIPSPERYLDGHIPKHHLKSLLAHRVPEYDTSKSKRGGGLPTKRWMSTGPLRRGFEKYGLPDHLPETVKSELLDNPRMASWNALCFKIWEDRVLTDSELKIGPNAKQISVRPEKDISS